MKKFAALLLAVCLLLCGCDSWTNGKYSYVAPHQMQSTPQKTSTFTVSSTADMKKALQITVSKGEKSVILMIQGMDIAAVENSMQESVHYLTTQDPMGSYAVADISYNVGSNGQQQAVSVNLEYRHDAQEIQKIRHAEGIAQMCQLLETAMTNCEATLVIRVSDYEPQDFNQLIANIMDSSPDVIMELPQVAANLYPESGTERVVELKFTYQTSRDDLRNMRAYVEPIFASSTLYVSGEEVQDRMYARLWTFLMETQDYKRETSITPSYSLLRHGVGDSKALAVVFARMCELAGLECLVVPGTRLGEAHVWNMICEDGVYYHLDLEMGFIKYTDGAMQGYVWDYSAYPKCGVIYDHPAQTGQTGG